MKLFQSLISLAVLACWLSLACATVAAVDALYAVPRTGAIPTLVAPEVTITGSAAHS
jgi:hypothetical protein